ncbi:hypothetical protein Q7306_05525 [Glaesserella parasuis]|uniref:Uncharacterized protein n=6 Tax=Glaesserella parasuis TaxID=738 RepID=B8F7E2_GLAP5|nr:hypothetical protein [Glaesserella parasuis]AGO17403.1 hypothetical protein K756_11580 [Glaesserella parasuis ZJ0906]ACL33244.1 hypothetical protein HAPS_1722 [Glaesserella parasuis SH0165]AIK18074.1 hypothetical protein JL26_10095 [Glaesserella parasuis]AIK90686.1 hypothetical protein JT17_08235 [Glaesserella parasuis]ATW44668.1 hypothetical protein A2U21_01065 [Glaesserella parasuis str. Nagasaki]
MKKSTALFVSALAMATAAYAQNPQSTVSTKGNTTMTAQVQTNNIRNAQALINILYRATVPKLAACLHQTTFNTIAKSQTAYQA